MPEAGTKSHKNSASLFRKSPSIPEAFSHQRESTQFGLINPRVFDMSDAGTGKTRAWLDVLRERIKVRGGKALVLAPKTILKSAWADDIRKFTPELTYSIAYAHNRKKAFEADVDIYITNHDAVKALQKNRRDWLEGRGFHTLIVDESTAFKHRTSQRSKALAKLCDIFDHRTLLTGTPNPNGLLDLWHQVFLLDSGDRLGDSFWRYRSVVCEPQQVGPSPQHLKWHDKDGMDLAVSELLEDITVRHIFEECTDIPENHEYTVKFELARDHRRAYEVLKEHAVLELEAGGITAFNASVVANKLLQLSSGAVYDDEGVSQLYDTARYELVLDLAEQRDQCVVAFNWRHQRDQLTQLADTRGISYGIIDGSVSAKRRTEIVDLFQAGLIRIIFAHPASAGHGLTLTRGRATIWASPVYNAEHFVQFNKRIYRIGQHHRTETILVVAENTIDAEVAKKLMGKVEKMDDLLELLA
jgi:SNF2 family DNA or RNA helicase